jgi:nucleoside-diphosphate-sugar epimerase
MTEMRKHLFCFGFGYTARELARQLPRDGWRITGTRRSDEGCARIREAGHDAVLFDGETPMDSSVLDGVTHVLHSISPGANGDPVLRLHGDDLAARADQIAWFGYLSTTGVYGDRGGDWVDEASSLEPSTSRGQARLEAEAGWFGMREAFDLPVHVFRLAGIYGPGRNQIEGLRNGTAKRIVKPGQVFSRIHVEDIAGILRASMAHPNPGSAYNVCDDEPAPPQDVVKWAAELIGIEPPPEVAFDDAELSPMAKSFYSESKKVSNVRVKDELGYEFRYPTFREGLKALA